MTRIGALYQGNNRCEFRVWAPLRQQIVLRMLSPGERELPLEKDSLGYWQTAFDGVPPGSRYWYLLDGRTQRSDPASHYQPEGVHGPSEVVDHTAFLSGYAAISTGLLSHVNAALLNRQRPGWTPPEPPVIKKEEAQAPRLPQYQ